LDADAGGTDLEAAEFDGDEGAEDFGVAVELVERDPELKEVEDEVDERDEEEVEDEVDEREDEVVDRDDPLYDEPEDRDPEPMEEPDDRELELYDEPPERELMDREPPEVEDLALGVDRKLPPEMRPPLLAMASLGAPSSIMRAVTSIRPVFVSLAS